MTARSPSQQSGKQAIDLHSKLLANSLGSCSSAPQHCSCRAISKHACVDAAAVLIGNRDRVDSADCRAAPLTWPRVSASPIMANGNEELNHALLETEALLNGEAHSEVQAPQSAFAAVAAEPEAPREKPPRRPRHVSRRSFAIPPQSLPCLTLQDTLPRNRLCLPHRLTCAVIAA